MTTNQAKLFVYYHLGEGLRREDAYAKMRGRDTWKSDKANSCTAWKYDKEVVKAREAWEADPTEILTYGDPVKLEEKAKRKKAKPKSLDNNGILERLLEIIEDPATPAASRLKALERYAHHAGIGPKTPRPPEEEQEESLLGQDNAIRNWRDE